jgi:serine/threonine protein kinase
VSDDKTRIAGRHSVVEIGTELNQTYRIDSPIGVGGMGEVFKGHNIQTGDPVAIKIVLPEFARDEMIIGLFRKEARILNHLNHDAIVRYHVFSIDPAIERPYLAMEFVDGPSLAAHVRTNPLAASDFMPLLQRLADALHKAHEAGVIHRDMSPDNVILPGGSVKDAKIIDFGIARSANVGGGTLLGGSFAGKYSYVSPEQLGLYGGEVTPKSDIYSLALVMAAAIRGTPLDMGGSQAEVIDKRRQVPDLAGVPKQFQPLLQAMLQPDPAKRPASMAEVRDWPGEEAAVRARPARPPGSDRATGDGKPKNYSGPALPGAPSRALRNLGFVVAALAVAAVGALGGWIFVNQSLTKQDKSAVATQPQPDTTASAGQGTANDASPTTTSAPLAAATDQSRANNPQPAATEPTHTLTRTKPTQSAVKTGAQPDTSSSPLTTPEANVAQTPGKQMASLEPPSSQAALSADQLRDFVASYGAGKCFVATAIALGSQTATITALGTPSSAKDLVDAFMAKARFAPELALDEVTASQCALLSQIPVMSTAGAKPIELKIAKSEIRGNNSDTGAAGDPLNITISGVGERNLYLFVMDHNGGIQNINRLCAACIVTKPDQTTAALTLFSPAKPEGESLLPFYPELVFAVASAKPLISINAQDAFDAGDFIPPFVKEVGTGTDVTTAVAYVKLKPQ